MKAALAEIKQEVGLGPDDCHDEHEIQDMAEIERLVKEEFLATEREKSQMEAEIKTPRQEQ